MRYEIRKCIGGYVVVAIEGCAIFRKTSVLKTMVEAKRELKRVVSERRRDDV